MIRTSTLALLALVLHQVSADGLNTRAQAAGKDYFGSALDNTQLSSDLQIVANTSDFGQITPGNSMKWDATEPSQGSFSFNGGDAIADFAEQNGQLLRCHTLVWYSQLPAWVSGGGFDNETLIRVMEDHITGVVTHYKGRCHHWDVVNEALNEDGSYRDNVFLQTIGETYIPLAFKAAAAADPDAKLYYNDYNIELSGPKANGAQRIVNLIKSHGARIDGVGLQAHLIVGQVGPVSGLVTNLQGFTDLDVDVAYTELDIRAPTPISSSDLAQQATDYHNVVTACNSVSQCVGVTIWGWSDGGSWIPGVFPGEGDALPWDANNQKKPAYYAILDGWSGPSNRSQTH